ncbi:MAG: glycosyltransferase family 39 protein [Salinivirgaceae bacterium]|nr:glycosyltransferase family 39 protein [Salinivirgaceae bacterium]
MKLLTQIDRNYLIIFVLSSLIFIPFLGQVHLFDWDEINFAESAREMLVSGDFLTVQINFEAFWEKPPLFIWMQALSMSIFGVNEFAARFPNAICGIATLLILYAIGKKTSNKQFGIIWVLAYAGSILPFLYFKTGIIDPWFNLFIFLGIYFAINYTDSDFVGSKSVQATLAGLAIGLGILTKGPVALLIFAIVGIVLLIIKRFKIKFTLKEIALFTIALILTGGFWFILQIMVGNYTILADFIEYQIRLFKTQDAGHGGFLLYHFVVVFLGVFPASVFALGGFRKQKELSTSEDHFRLIMVILLLTVLILFTIVKTKILHYSSLAYFPVTYLAARFINSVLKKEQRIPMWQNSLIAFLGFSLALPMFGISMFNKIKPWLLQEGRIKDDFAVANLGADVVWTGFEFIIGLILLFGLFHYFRKANKTPKQGLLVLSISSILYINLTLLFVITKVEGYTQNAAIEFYKTLQNKDVYIETLGFKSYAHLFYTQKKEVEEHRSRNKDWLLKGDIDKDAYFVSKITSMDNLLKLYPTLLVLDEKNGFVFYKRKH